MQCTLASGCKACGHMRIGTVYAHRDRNLFTSSFQTKRRPERRKLMMMLKFVGHRIATHPATARVTVQDGPKSAVPGKAAALHGPRTNVLTGKPAPKPVGYRLLTPVPSRSRPTSQASCCGRCQPLSGSPAAHAPLRSLHAMRINAYSLGAACVPHTCVPLYHKYMQVYSVHAQHNVRQVASDIRRHGRSTI